MPIRNYPFHTVFGSSAPGPWLPIRIINSHSGQEFSTWGLVDTGASLTSIPRSIATHIGHDLDATAAEDAHTGSGQTNWYPHTCRIEILMVLADGSVDENNVVHTIGDNTVGVLAGMPFVLLGVKNFLDRHILTINYPEQIFSILRP